MIAFLFVLMALAGCGGVWIFIQGLRKWRDMAQCECCGRSGCLTLDVRRLTDPPGVARWLHCWKDFNMKLAFCERCWLWTLKMGEEAVKGAKAE